MTNTIPNVYDWAASRGAQWRDQLDGMESMLARVDAPLIAALGLTEPLQIADIGCGGGGTTRSIAAAAAIGSAVQGFDISPDLVEAARERSGGALGFTLADAAIYRPAERFDRLTSRFGVMFFDDPAAAFANLAGWLVPGGRLAFAVWGPGPEVSFMAAVRAAMESVIEVPRADPDAPGPCRYGDPQKLIDLLEHAGLVDAASQTWRGELVVGQGLAADTAADFLLETSSTAAPIAHAPAQIRDAVRARLSEICARHTRDGIVQMPVRVEIITARAPSNKELAQ